MAKKTIGNIFSKTAPAEGKPEGKPKPYGVYLGAAERAAMAKILKETGANQHAVLQFAVKLFIQMYEAGKVKIEKETVTRLKL